MNRNVKGFLFVVGMSVVSAVTLRFALGRVQQSLAPPPDIPGVTTPAPTPAEIERRFVGCGRFNFAFDARGYSSRQWPEELVPEGPLFRADAFFVARSGDILPVLGDSLGAALGGYELVGTEVRIGFWGVGAGDAGAELPSGSGAESGAGDEGPVSRPHAVLEAVLEAQGDSLAGPLFEVVGDGAGDGAGAAEGGVDAESGAVAEGGAEAAGVAADARSAADSSAEAPNDLAGPVRRLQIGRLFLQAAVPRPAGCS